MEEIKCLNLFWIPESVWFILSNGQDNADCGHSASTACKSFDWLLRRYQAAMVNVSQTLILTTDCDLMVDHRLVVSEVITAEQEILSHRFNLNDDYIGIK